MKTWLSLFIGLSVVAVASSPARGQPAADKLSPEQIERFAESKRLSSEAVKLHRQGKPKEAADLVRQALKICEEIFGSEHPNTAIQLTNLAFTVEDQGENDEAQSYLERALLINQKILGEAHPVTANSLNQLARFHKARGDFDKARNHYAQVLEIRKKALGEDHPDTAAALNNLGSILQIQGRFEEAKALLERALHVRKKVLGAEHADTIISLNNLGSVLLDLGDYATAKDYLEQSLSIAKKVFGEEHPRIVSMLNNLGAVHEAQSDFVSAKSFYDEALRIRLKELGDVHPLIAPLHNNLGGLFQAQGDYASARLHFEAALKTDRQTLGEEHPATANVMSNLGSLLFMQREFGAAQAYQKRALEIRKKILAGDHPDIAKSLNALGLLCAEQEDFAAAQSYHEQALKICMASLGAEHPITAETCSNLGYALKCQGNYELALEYYQRALSVCSQVWGEEHRYTADAMSNISVLAMLAGDADEARDMEDRVRRSVNSQLHRVLPGLPREKQLLFLQEKYRRGFHIALSIGLSQQQNSKTVDSSANWLLNGKAVAQTALAQSNLLMRDASDPQLAAIIQKLNSTRSQLAQLSLSTAARDQRQERQKEIENLTREEAELTHRISQTTGQREPSNDSWVTLESVRKAVPQDAVLIEIARFRVLNFQAKGKDQWQPARYVAWLIPATGKGDVEIIDLGLSEEVEAAIEQANFAIQSAALADSVARIEGDQIAVEQLSGDLAPVAKLVWKPLAEKIPVETKRLILSPDGALWLLPWAALPVAKDKYLLEEYSLRFEVSGRDLIRGRANETRTNRPLIFADPDFDLDAESARTVIKELFPKLDLEHVNKSGSAAEIALPKMERIPNTKLEAEAVAPNMASISGQAPKLFTGKSALEFFVKMVRRPNILMLSTHGFFLPDWDTGLDGHIENGQIENRQIKNPLLRCGLMLAGCNSKQAVGDDDGVLTGLEVVGLDLRGTEMVVLSACDTGLGVANYGEGVAGLRQAFQLAGAESVVATLWQVPDRDSTLIMNDFFAELADGQSRSDALRNAQLKRIESRRKLFGAAHPYFWAAWTLTGGQGSEKGVSE